MLISHPTAAAAPAAHRVAGGGGTGGYGGLGRRPVPCTVPCPAPPLVPCPLKPCPAHAGRSYCPTDKTPGQCDKPTRTAPCPPCPATPPSPPPVPPVPGPPCAGGFNTSNHGMCPGPNYHGCLNATARALPYCNTSLSTDQRIESLIGSASLSCCISLSWSPTVSRSLCLMPDDVCMWQ
jgi:hypothetical protein